MTNAEIHGNMKLVLLQAFLSERSDCSAVHSAVSVRLLEALIFLVEFKEINQAHITRAV